MSCWSAPAPHSTSPAGGKLSCLTPAWDHLWAQLQANWLVQRFKPWARALCQQTAGLAGACVAADCGARSQGVSAGCPPCLPRLPSLKKDAVWEHSRCIHLCSCSQGCGKAYLHHEQPITVDLDSAIASLCPGDGHMMPVGLISQEVDVPPLPPKCGAAAGVLEVRPQVQEFISMACQQVQLQAEKGIAVLL